MKFLEEFPSFIGDSGWYPISIVDPYRDSSYCWDEESIKKHCLDKQRVKKALIIGLSCVVSPKCEKPYGDTCGYCTSCKRYQESLIKRINEKIGLE